VSRKKQKPRRTPRRLLLILLALLILLVAAGAGLHFRDAWRRSAPVAEEPEAPMLVKAPRVRLEEAVFLGAGELGVPRQRVARRPGTAGIPHYEIRCPDRLHPFTANRWLSRVFQDGGVRIADCVEDGDPALPKLLYRLAVDSSAPDAAFATLQLFPPMGKPPPGDTRPRLALILDDLGGNFGRAAQGILDLDLPLTASILPGQRFSAKVEQEARRRGHAVFLHLPMEPLGYPDKDPGYGALFTGVSADSVTRLLEDLAGDFVQFDGFNNHMGSKASQDEAIVGPLLDWARRRRLLVVDSMTDARSRIYPLARARDLPVLRVDVTLDSAGEDEARIMENLALAAETARKRGWALAICHPRPETLRALSKAAPRLGDTELRFVTVPQLFASLGDSDPYPQIAGGREH
jgi:polysaccharide deacetylase 2 family uncharacterized protein YibQ